MRTDGPHWHSAGAVVYTMFDGMPHYVLVKERSGHVSHPKGRVEAGESPAQTALREIWEETGLRVRLSTEEALFNEYYLLREGGDKRVDYFIACYDAQTPACDGSEVLQVLLLPYQEARAALALESGREILDRAHEIITRQ